MSRHGDREIEIKLRLQSVAQGEALLASAGFEVSEPRVFEANTLFDTPLKKLRKAGKLLRVRQVEARAILTYKGPARVSKHKDRQELELTIADPGTMSAILEQMGYRPTFRYEKFRTEYRMSGSGGTATLDETPAGVFLELEGEPAWIDEVAGKLGFTEPDYITASYIQLYVNHCKRQGIVPADMVFNQTGSKSQPNPGSSEGRV